jgi:hypothetical protein
MLKEHAPPYKECVLEKFKSSQPIVSVSTAANDLPVYAFIFPAG